jgi:hypothetical protein
MELLVHVVMVICFIFSSLSLFAKWTGAAGTIFILKVVALIGTLSPILFYINYFNLLGTQV